MKKILFILAAVLLSVSMNAADMTGKKIYINPGHGSFGPNDRPMATIPYPNLPTTGMPDTLGFYESNTNLWKCLYLGERLKAAGATIIYSRTQSGPWPYTMVNGDYPDYTSDGYKQLADYERYNRNLSEICEEVEANGMDMFISVHSNAATEGTSTNYPLVIYRGKDKEPAVANSDKMAAAIWPYRFEIMNSGIDPYSNYSMTNTNLRGDVSFYGSSECSTRHSETSGNDYYGYLGVLKHGAPGFLVEGYFHTYQPARHRALNPDYCHQEGLAYYRGIIDYFGADKDTKGYIMGTVKDLHERIQNKLFNYSAKTNDQWLPCNGAVVTLYKAGVEVAKYNVDTLYNGIFVFENLEPGNDYTLDASCEGYKSLFDEYKANISVKANETSYAMLYLESESYVPPQIHYYNYPDPEQPSYATLAAKFEMKQSFTNKTIDALAGKTIRRALYRDGNIIVLALEENNDPLLVSINAETGAIQDTLPTDFCAVSKKGMYKLSDIAFTAEGYLIGCNMEAVTFTPSSVFYVYKWEQNAAGWKGEILQTTTSNETAGNYSNAMAGTCLAYSGTLEDGTLFSTAYTTGADTHGVRFFMYTFSGGQYAGAMRNQNSAYTLSGWGHDLAFTVSPNADDQIIATAANINPLEWKVKNSTASAPTVVGNFPIHVQGANYFKYAGRNLMVTPIENGVALYDITGGVQNAKLIETTNTTLEGNATYTSAFATVSGTDITIYLVRDNTISKFTTIGVDQPAVAHIVAYNLNATFDASAETYNVSFYANSDAQSANIIFYNSENEVAGTLPLKGVKAGENQFTIKGGMLPGEVDDTFTWGLELNGNAVPGFGKIFTDNNTYASSRLYATVNINPENENFGYMYVMHREGASVAGNGLFEYKYDGTRLNSTPYKQEAAWGNPMRMGIDENGLVFASDWSDNHPGAYVFDPATKVVSTFFESDAIASSGMMTKNGVEVACSSPGLTVYGKGENRKLYLFTEDGGSTLKTNGIAIYNIGTKTSWGEAPSFASSLTGQANGNSAIVADDYGFYVSQYRGAGSNGAGVPAVSYYNMNGQRLWASDAEEIKEVLNGCQRGGFAVNKERNLLVIHDAAGQFVFFDVNSTAEGITVTYKYTYKHGMTDVLQMDFDYAGNLVVAAGTYGGNMKLYIFTIPTSNNSIVVPARKTITMKKTPATAVTGVSFTSTEVEVEKKQTIDVSGLVAIAPQDATNTLVTWKSADNSIATVDEDGIVTGMGVGRTTITVTTLDGGFTAQLTVNVKPIAVTGVRILSGNNGVMEVASGDSNYALAFEVLPADAENKNTTWSTNNDDLITIQAQPGLITPLAKGEAWVYVTTEDGGFKDSILIVIDGGNNPIFVDGVSLNIESDSLYVGETLTLIATVTPNNADDKSVTWTSSNTDVATVADGVVSALAAGETTITVTTTDGNYTATCTITVVEVDGLDNISTMNKPQKFIQNGHVYIRKGETIYMVDGRMIETK